MTDSTPARKNTGCGQIAAITALLLWFTSVPPPVMLAMALVSGIASSALRTSGAIVLTAGALLLPFVGVALVTRRRPAWKSVAATAASLAGVAGYLVLDAALRALFPEAPTWLGVTRLVVLLPYLLFAARLVPWLGGRPKRSVFAWLGLDQFNWPTLALSLALAAMLTLPWPVTGALGDRYTSLDISFRAFAELLPTVLLIWGLVFTLLTSTFESRWAAGFLTMVTYAGAVAGGVIPNADVGAMAKGLVALPLAFLLTELRARKGGIYPVLLLIFLHLMMPRLFVDPRDAVMQGIPELQHILSFVIIWLMLGLAALSLWFLRLLLLEYRHSIRIPAPVWSITAGLAAVLMAGSWFGLYLFTGNPGFNDDSFLIIMQEQADLRDAYGIPEREARIHHVYDALVETAERAQAPVRADLEARGLSYRPYYIINMIRVDGHRDLMRRFEGEPGVAQVILNPNVREYPHRITFPYTQDPELVAGAQPNLEAIHAAEAWNLGVTGEGIVVAGQDSGYDWTHPALKLHYRGWDGQTANHDYNWHDAWDDTAVPFDDDNHGTHTLGTVLGDDGDANHTGVAPGARWIGCRNMRRGIGNPGSYAECMEFFLAPYPHGGDPFTAGDVTMAPHVINNSWGCPPEEGCSADTLEAAVEALRAAGIMMVVSAGNEGPACDSVTAPPADFDASFSVGATDDNGTVVGFSSRGPVGDLLKPDVSAPGYEVRSSIPGGMYGSASGTSMAGPHVTGLVALIWSANPDLIGDIDATEALICRTATPKPIDNACAAADAALTDPLGLEEGSSCACGSVTGAPNNVYGCGVINADAAVRAALEDR